VKRPANRPINLRLRRLLVMLPWLQERGTVSTHEMADHFGVGVDELVADLTLASLCGVSQDPRDLIDLYVDGDEIHFGLPKYFDRPLRLTAPEAFSLVVSATAARSLPGSDPDGSLSSAIDKIAGVIGVERVAGLDVEVDVPDDVDALRDATRRRAIVEMEYWSPETAATTTRQVALFEVFAEGAHWYVRGFDMSRDAERTFRVDRIESWLDTGGVDTRPVGPRRAWFEDSDDVREVTIVIDAGWLWVLDQYPVIEASTIGTDSKDAGSDDEGRVRVRLVVTSDRWLERLMVRLGRYGRIESPDDLRGVGSVAARRILARYERT